MTRAFVFSAAVTAILLTRGDASACFTPGPGPMTAIPRKGATNVPTAVDIVVIAPAKGTLTLEGGGDVLPLTALFSHGRGVDAVSGAVGEVVRYRPGLLKGTTEYVAKLTPPVGTAIELTRFTTAAGYSKPAGTPAEAKSLTLTRIRYPVSDIGSGNCVGAEYHGFATFDWTIASFPDTPADSIVHVLDVSAKTGGHSQSFVWIGTTPYLGEAATGEKPLPVGRFHPYLDPTREYCLSVSAWPFGEATLSTTSAPVCTTVRQRAVPGALPITNCAEAAPCPTTDAGSPATPDAASPGPSASAAPTPSPSASGGCQVARGAGGDVVLWLMAVAAWTSRRAMRRAHGLSLATARET